MGKTLKKILYSKIIKKINVSILGLIYNKKYLKGKFFDEKRMGFYWAWKCIGNKVFGRYKNFDWPISNKCYVSNCKNIEFHPNSINIFQSPGCYYQNHKAKIIIGDSVHIAPNVGLITTNHDILNLDNHIDGKEIKIDDFSWIGMNAVILPGVHLGPRTIVGAGAVVTKSYPEGNVVIAGVPAKILKEIK